MMSGVKDEEERMADEERNAGYNTKETFVRSETLFINEKQMKLFRGSLQSNYRC